MRACKNCSYRGSIETFPSAGIINNKRYYRHTCKVCYNNQKERDKYAYNTCKCGYKKYYRAKTCAFCKARFMRESRRERTLDDALTQGASRTKWSQVRRDANQLLAEIGREKKCAVCGFIVFVQCCHIKPICEFSMTTKLKEVNNSNNLVYLCPNHHVMLDRGLIELNTPVV